MLRKEVQVTDLIPICGSLNLKPRYTTNCYWSKKAGAYLPVNNGKVQETVEREIPEVTTSVKKVMTQEELEQDENTKWMIRPLFQNDETRRLDNGVVVTKVGGWEPAPFPEISMMNLNEVEEKFEARQVVQKHAIYLVRLENVVSPSNFFVEFIIDPPNDGYETWTESLQHFYNDPEVAANYKLRTLRPYVGQMYVIKDTETGEWKRIRIHRIDPPNHQVLGLYLDYLSFSSAIGFTELHELHPKYGNWQRYPAVGELVDILPKNLDPTDQTNWCEEAKDYFREFVKDKLFRAFVVSKSLNSKDNVWHAHDGDKLFKVSIILFPIGDKNVIPVNARLIKKGYAAPSGSMLNWAEQVELFHNESVKVENPVISPPIIASKDEESSPETSGVISSI